MEKRKKILLIAIPSLLLVIGIVAYFMFFKKDTPIDISNNADIKGNPVTPNPKDATITVDPSKKGSELEEFIKKATEIGVSLFSKDTNKDVALTKYKDFVAYVYQGLAKLELSKETVTSVASSLIEPLKLKAKELFGVDFNVVLAGEGRG